MTDEERAVIEYVRGTNLPNAPHLMELRKALIASEQPPAPVWPDPPTDHVAWQSIGGAVDGTAFASYKRRHPADWRKLRVTYTPVDDPAPVVHERWGVLWGGGTIGNKEDFVIVQHRSRAEAETSTFALPRERKLVRIAATEVPT